MLRFCIACGCFLMKRFFSGNRNICQRCAVDNVRH